MPVVRTWRGHRSPSGEPGLTALASLAAELHQVGLDAGLDVVGIAPATPFERARRNLFERRDAGLHGGMEFTYRNPLRSTDPSRIVEDAAALVVGARNYWRHRPDGRPTDGTLPGRIARYSWQDHYGPLREALEVIADRLRADQYAARVVADDNALVDREAAFRAGLGWYGKNTNVLLPGRGSWFVLGAVVTNAALPAADEPVADGCGACNRCLQACPTGALIGPGILDARRCLAWLLEAPGVFPIEYRVALGDRIYGCDDCQEVCPINVKATHHSSAPPPDRRDQPVADVLEILASTDEALLKTFGRWYIPQRQPRYLRRNALVVLGNCADGGDERVCAALRRALRDEDAMIRAHAVWASARLRCGDLLGAIDDDPDPLVQAELAAASNVTSR